jgi:hypothetical protein
VRGRPVNVRRPVASRAFGSGHFLQGRNDPGRVKPDRFRKLWEGRIRPRLIPGTEIDSLALAMVGRHGGSAAAMAFIEEDRAWRYSRPFERGKWRRVRKRIERLETFAEK